MNKCFVILYFISVLSYGSDRYIVGFATHETVNNLSATQWVSLTHLNIAFLNPNAGGSLVLGAYLGNGDFSKSTTDLKYIVKKARKYHVKVLVSLAGGGFWGDRVMIDRYKKYMSPIHRVYFIQSLYQYVIENNLDGIDIDIEGDAINEYIGDFIIELADLFQSNDLIVTASWPAQSVYADKVPKRALDKLNFLNVMSYDATGDWNPKIIGHHAPINRFIDDALYWLQRGIPNHKIVMGVPFYGKRFDRDRVVTILYKEIVSYNRDAHLNNQIDQLYYDGIPNVIKKIKIVDSLNLKGLMIWELSQDAPEQHKSLLRVIFQNVSNIRSDFDDIKTVSDTLHFKKAHSDWTLFCFTKNGTLKSVTRYNRFDQIDDLTYYKKNFNRRFERCIVKCNGGFLHLKE